MNPVHNRPIQKTLCLLLIFLSEICSFLEMSCKDETGCSSLRLNPEHRSLQCECSFYSTQCIVLDLMYRNFNLGSLHSVLHLLSPVLFFSPQHTQHCVSLIASLSTNL